MRYLLFSVSCLFLLCCTDHQQAPATKTLFQKISSEHSGIDFTNSIKNTKDFNIFRYRNFYNGGGVAIGDINNDGLSDIYLTANMGQNRLYLNKGNFQFEDITEKAGVGGTRNWSTGVVLVDINHDGWLDIYVCNAGYVEGDDQKNELFINQGANSTAPTFMENAADYNLDESGYTTHAAFFDYDLDGDLDCYILNNSFMPVNALNYSNNRDLYANDWPVEDFLKGGGDKLMRNDDGVFKDVTEEAGIYGSLIGFGLGITVGDINGDFLPDMYVSNDFYERDYLYINQGKGYFTEEIESWMEHLSHSSMGADMSDINNDGFPEIFVTEMLPDNEYRLKTTTLFENYNVYQLKQERGFYHQYMQNTLQLNNKDRSFSEIAYFAGVAASDWSWGALMFDADNDGWRDIYVCNGVYQDVIDQDFVNFFADEVIQKMVLTGKKEEMEEIIAKMPSNPQPNKAFHNQGDLTFKDKSEAWGFDIPSFSNGAAYGDLDNDGDLDLVVNNLNMESFLFQNQADQLKNHHYLKVKLVGSDKNPFAVGSHVFLHQGNKKINFQLIPSRGFQSSVDYELTFGLGDVKTIDSAEVIWPDLKRTVVVNPPTDTSLTIKYQQADDAPIKNLYDFDNDDKFLLEQIESPFTAHREDSHNDFYQEGLTMRKLSKEGPKVDAADVNNDGRMDVYIGGAANQPGTLYLQKSNGSFAPKAVTEFEKSAPFEDTAVRFFDADNDGDPDLFVGSGGNHQAPFSRPMQDRLYLNDGKGNFKLNQRALPMNGLNTSVAVPFDLDKDGDLDLYIGSRSMPGQYGVPARGYLLENDGNANYKDITRTKAPSLTDMMVTDATLMNMDGNGAQVLAVIGEWAYPVFYKIEEGSLKRFETNLSNYPGWWYAIETNDVDNDGDTDLLLGNRGENFYFTGSTESPAKLWVNDFDNNGMVEKIITRSIEGKDMPLNSKRELTEQLVSLKKQNIKHTEYATKSIQELFPEEVVKKSLVYTATYFQSAIAINEGNGQFSLQAFPKEVQFSCVYKIQCTDLNQDGKKDLILAGNDNGFTPQFSKLDASFGHVLINLGNGSFRRVENRESGFFVRGEVRDMIELKSGNSTKILVLLNNDQPKLFQLAADEM